MNVTVWPVPFRDLPSISAPTCCEVCSAPAEMSPCSSCRAVARLLDGLEIPVVVVEHRNKVGLGMVLVDRWRRIACCVGRLSGVQEADLQVVARARAATWAPTARIASNWGEFGEALEDTLFRTQLEYQLAVKPCFRRAVELAKEFGDRGALPASYGIRLGSWVEPQAQPIDLR